MIERKDLMLDFGTATEGVFPNVLDLGKGNADSYEVCFTTPVAISAATTFTVKGGAASGSVTNKIAETTVTSAPAGAKITVGIPRNHGYRYLAVATSSTAAVNAAIDAYGGR